MLPSQAALFAPIVPTLPGPIETRLFIDGAFADAASGKTFPTYNPATGTVLCEVAEAGAADVDRAAHAARRAFETVWKFTDGSRRRDLMFKAADLIEAHREELVALESLNNGKPVAEAHVDIDSILKCFRYYGGWADKIHGKTCPVDGSFLSFTKHEPVGVVGQIIPWNFPIEMVGWKLGPALAAGCTVILKPAEQTPLTALRLAALLHEAGFPSGVVNVLPGLGPTAGAAITTHPMIDKVAFTGSTAVGKIVMTAAAQTMKRVSLECGGKSALVICDDADLDAAIEAVHAGIFYNQGQVCSCSSRVYVQRGVYESFLRQLIAATRDRITLGNPFHPSVTMGPLVSAQQYAIVRRYIDIGKYDDKADCLLGGEDLFDTTANTTDPATASSTARLCAVLPTPQQEQQHHPHGYFVPPTIFANVTDTMRIAREEIFGPVLCVLPFDTLPEAIARSNDSDYGLAAGVFSKDIGKVLSFASEVKAGTVWINTYHNFDIAQPFGGFKASGFGRELGDYALQLYTEVKTVMIKLVAPPVKN